MSLPKVSYKCELVVNLSAEQNSNYSGDSALQSVAQFVDLFCLTVLFHSLLLNIAINVFLQKVSN